jgi:hydrogenase maturation protein HypF
VQTYCIHIKGIVQGVGFRPYIYRLAHKYKLLGEVSNGTGGVHFYFNGDATIASMLVNEILSETPSNAVITSIQYSELSYRSYNDFKIALSYNENEYTAVCPDFAICTACKDEMLSPSNRRYLYPFITCTNCGPRLSIIHRLPYDRVNTTMEHFTMCDDCQREYDDINDRRYYSQTNSCYTCGVQVFIQDNRGDAITYSIETIVQALHDAKIIAVKGIGGYLLLCDASQPSTVKKLRERKLRKSKPLAIMVKNKNALQDLVLCNPIQYETMTSSVSPIVLCEIKDKENEVIDYEGVAPSLDHLGVMLPNTGLLMLIAQAYPHPLVCTSANLSGSPIFHNDEDVKHNLSNVYDLLVSHNREIIVPQDDSVLKHSHFYQKPIVIRRSRGLAPNFWIDSSVDTMDTETFAFGADLKNSFALSKDGNIYISQFLGDQSSYETQQAFQSALNHFTTLVDAKINQKVIDDNAMYFVNGIANEKWKNVLTHKLQHHKAHFYAVLFENGLINNDKVVLGVIWDGIGYGDDHQIWGGEIFEYNDASIQRVAHIQYFDYLLGDAMSLQPRIAALAFMYNEEFRHLSLVDKFSEKEWHLYCKMLANGSKVKTCSVGRIFDAVASILDLTDVNEYEGQAAILLEQLALSYFKLHGIDSIVKSYTIEILIGNIISLDKLKNELLFDLNQEQGKSYIAAKFHVTLADLIGIIAKEYEHIAFSGGVFQNGLLIDLIMHKYKNKYNLYFNKSVSPNDENISLGQMAYSLTHKQQQQCA